jgi:carbamoylphosphate synthase large subunit
MSDRITEVHPRGGRGPAFALNGRVSRALAIASYRGHYERQRVQAETALSFNDDELIAETYLGPYAQRDRQEVIE